MGRTLEAKPVITIYDPPRHFESDTAMLKELLEIDVTVHAQ
jgi:hypothetical protein